MKRWLSVLLMVIFVASFAHAKVVDGVNMPDYYTVGKTKLVLNGTGVRRKFIFIKVYVAGLYVQKKSSNPEDILKQNVKVVRMHFTYSHIGAERIRNAFKDDLERVAPDVLKSKAGQEFLNIFKFDVKEGDNIDLIFDNGTLTVMYNSKKMGSIASKPLCDAVLNIYIGSKPTQESLKRGLLGK